MRRSDSNKASATGRWRSALHALISLLILLVLTVLVQQYVGWPELLRPWLGAEPLQLGFAVALVMSSYALRAMRLYDYFSAEMKGSFVTAYKVMLQHNVLNNFLPMRSGELSFPLLMSRYFGIGAGRSVPALLWFRILDLHTLGLLALLAAAARWLEPTPSLMIALAFVTVPWWLYRFNARLLHYLGPVEGGRVRGLLVQLLSGLPATHGPFWRSWAWTLGNWLVKLAVFAWVLRLFADVPLAGSLLGVIGGELTSVLPVHSVAGVGTYEAGIMTGLLPWGVPTGSALQAAVNLHLFLLGVSVLGAAISLFMGKPSNVTG